jgi:hypothetical protein
MDVAAEKATELHRLGSPRMKLNVHASHTGMKGKQKVLSASGSLQENRKGRTGTNRGTPSMVNFLQELGAWDRAVAAKGVHHPQI